MVGIALANNHFFHDFKSPLVSNRKSQEVSTTVLGSRVQYLLGVTFLLSLFCSDTILASMPE